ncbi:MAG: hypothetical protein ABIQ09_03390 [Jatrophihabitantaceae bacterium]
MVRARRRAVGGGAVGLLIGGVITGCSPELRGQIGLTLDASGALSAVVVTCGAGFDGADLVDVTVESEHYPRLGLWKHDGKLPKTAGWPITGDEPGRGWSAVRPWDGKASPGHRYVLQAGRVDGDMLDYSHAVSSYLTFTAEDLRRVSSGMVLRTGAAENPDAPVLQTSAAFVEGACKRD